MITEKRFLVAWGALFMFSAVILVISIGGISKVVDAFYASYKNEAVVKADSLLNTTQTPRATLLLKADLLWQNESLSTDDAQLLLKTKQILKAEHSVFYSLILKHNIYWLLFILPFIFLSLVWKDKIEVAPEWALIAEWGGKKMVPLKNGYHYPFRYFGFFKERAEVPMNKQTLCMLSGVRDGLSQELTGQYVYGTASNMEPDTGSFLRLLYKVEFKCEDPTSLVYNVEDPFEYVAGLIELKVGVYVHGEISENIIDEFSSKDLNSIISVKERFDILTDTGIKLISFIPVDVINTPEVEAVREKLDEERRQSAIITAQLENEVKREEGKKGILEAQLVNMEVQENIAKKTDKILANQISSIKISAGIDGGEALKFITKDKTLKAVTESAKNGNIVYIDEASNGNLSQAAALGFAINATSKK